MIAESLAQYRIIKKLGKGGMGEVYLAQDTKLDRKVAIKILSAEALAHENAKKRLIREAQAAAKLDHPNICAIYDVNEVESLTFIVMQYVEGETLADRMKDKRLPLSTALDVARQAAEALAEAHEHGIVHRDIKPQNIMITPRGLVKILDFGLCKQLQTNDNVDNEAPTMSLLSTPGLIIGTIPYMSPEQLSGEPVDEASDIFSLGITFYEMLAGKNPFKAQSAAVTMSQILTKEVFPSELTDISPELQGLLKKMLNKEKGQRYRSATELLADLNLLPPQLLGGDETQSLAPRTSEQTSPPTKGPPAPGVRDLIGRYKWAALASLLGIVLAVIGIRYFLSGEKLDSLAILPFTYASNDAQLMANPDHEYLSDGLTESIINNLSQLPDLRVIARSSVFSYKGKNLNAQAIGRELSVRAVLAGQISQNGDVLTIKAELIDVQSNRRLWYGDYPGKKIADIQVIQKEIAQGVSERLRLNLTGADQTHLAKTYTESGEAYEAYLKGRYHWNKRTEEGFKQATKFFQEAIAKDPTYALAYTGLADCYTLRTDYGLLRPEEGGYALARTFVTLALKYDDSLAEAHTSLASIKAGSDWDWQGAENEYLRAIELNPNYATAHHWYAAQLMVEGKLDKARLEIRKAQQLDPMSLAINKDFAVILLFARDYDEAMKQCRATLDIKSDFLVMSTYIAQIYELQGKYPEAIVELEKAHAAALDDGEITYGLAQAYALGGKKEAAAKLANELNQPSKENIYLPKEAAYLTFLLGDKDNAVAIVQKAYGNHYLSVAEIKMDPRFDGLRADPRVAKILQDIGLGQ